MKFIRKTFRTIGISLILVFLFKGFIYRLAVSYTEVGTRTVIRIENQDLIAKIKSKMQDEIIGLPEVVAISRSITNESLSFTFKSTSYDPNKIFISQKANCKGYSAMFNSIANYIIEENGLSLELNSIHHIGELQVFGFDIHQLFEDSFYNDHDYNVVKNLATGESIAIDPSISDYIGVHSVNYR